jgi:hypothetical protein
MGTLASALRPIAQDLADAPRVYVDANVPAGVVAAMRRELHWDVLYVMEHDELRRAPHADHPRPRLFRRPSLPARIESRRRGVHGAR